MSRWLYLLSIQRSKVDELIGQLKDSKFDPITRFKIDDSKSENVEITISVDVQGKAHKKIVEGLFSLCSATQHGAPFRLYEERKFIPTKFFRFLRKYAKHKWVEGLAIYLGTLVAVGGFPLAELIHENFSENLWKDFNFFEFFVLSALPAVIHIFYTYAQQPRESEVKLDENSD